MSTQRTLNITGDLTILGYDTGQPLDEGLEIVCAVRIKKTDVIVIRTEVDALIDFLIGERAEYDAAVAELDLTCPATFEVLEEDGETLRCILAPGHQAPLSAEFAGDREPIEHVDAYGWTW